LDASRKLRIAVNDPCLVLGSRGLLVLGLNRDLLDQLVLRGVEGIAARECRRREDAYPPWLKSRSTGAF
jgi:hypothetical protein